ncbi:hypothetical protein EQZ09_04125 [Clostridium perfringens]|nr:hypothetical protein [Clostridium perfringens]
MLNNKLDLRVSLLTFIFNNKIMLEENLLDEIILKNSKKSISKLFNILNKKNNLTNLDEVNLLIKNYYSKEIYKKYNIKELYFIDRMSNLANEFISTRDDRFILKYWTCDDSKLLGEYNNINRIAMWNTLSREVVVDNMVFQYLLNKGMKENIYLSKYHSLVHIEDLQLQQILSKGVAETHLHVNAGINFEIKWMELMSSDFGKLGLKNINIASYGEISDEEAIYMIKQASIIRILLANFIFNRRYNTHFNSFYIESEFDTCNCKDNYCEYNKFSNNIDKILRFNLNLELDEWFNTLKQNYIDVSYYDYENNPLNSSISWDERLRNKDWINKIARRKVRGASIENIFLFECFKGVNEHCDEDHLCGDLRDDKIFVKLFYKYLLIKNIIYNLANEDNKIKGLDKFTDNFRVSTKLSSLNDMRDMKMMLGLHCQLENKNLSKLEFRISFPSCNRKSKMEKECIRSLISFFDFYYKLLKDIENGKIEKYIVPKLGIIYHLIKMTDDDEKCWINYVNDEYSKSLYYMKNREVYGFQIDILTNLRNTVPYLSKYIIGIDTASVEHYTEPWVFAPIFKKARENEQRILVSNEEYYPSSISSLGFTFHVGEDFRHILTGLRNIYEVITQLNFRAGDRIGHGIVLGIDIEKWIEKNEIVILPRIEYLENLLWTWHMYTKDGISIEYDINYIERKILEISKEIYGQENIITVSMLYRAYLDKFNNYSIKICEKEEICNIDTCIGNDEFFSNESFEFCSNFSKCDKIEELKKTSWNLNKLKCANHCKVYLKRMNEPIEIKINRKDLTIFRDLQCKVKNIVIERGIVVETNPTSNRAIGQIENIFEHYISNLNDVTKENNMLVTINTDDPCVFNSNINNEYAYIFYSLLHKGYERSLVLKWIDEVRQVALDTSFIKNRGTENIATMIREIDIILKVLRERII